MNNHAQGLIVGLEDVPKIVKKLVALKNSCAVYTFSGPLGAGKTTLIRQMLRAFGVKDLIQSPTFTYMNVYENAQGQFFYHFDLYRIESLEQFIAAGFDEFLYQPDSWAFIEWPDVIKPVLTHNVCNVSIEYVKDDMRLISYSIA